MYLPAKSSRAIATTKEVKLSHIWEPLDPTPESNHIVKELSRDHYVSGYLHKSRDCSSSLVKPNDALTIKLFRVTLSEGCEVAKEPR